MSHLSNTPSLETASHRPWEAARDLRRCLPSDESWRGCVGLGASVSRQDDTEYHGDAALVRNEQLRWVALRDLPAGLPSADRRMPHHDAHYASVATATLRYGMPRLDFTQDPQDAVHFRVGPFGIVRRSFPREFDLLARLSSRMTEFACFGVHADGTPARRPWFRKRPCSAKPFEIAASQDWMPTPYLAFPVAAIDQVTLAVIEGRSTLRKASAGDSVSRQPSKAVRHAFCKAVGHGLPLVSVGPSLYCGPTAGNVGNRGVRVNGLGAGAVSHRFRSALDRREHRVVLPARAKVLVRPGHPLEAGEPWCQALPIPPRDWQRRSSGQKWATLSDVISNRRLVDGLLTEWFTHQAVRLQSHPGLALWPAELVAEAVSAGLIAPVGLWWDLSPCASCVDSVSESIVFPAVPLHAWDQLRFDLGHDVLADFSVADPRFQRAGEPRRPERHRGRQAPYIEPAPRTASLQRVA